MVDIPGVLVCGRFDFQAPLRSACELQRRWPRSKLVIVDNAGHRPTETVTGELLCATGNFAAGS